MVISILVVIIAVTAVSSDAITSDSAPYVQTLKLADFYLFKSHPGVRLVYFWKPIKDRALLAQREQFLKEYEKSAKVMQVYDVAFAKLTCEGGPSEYCNRENVQNKVFVFRNGLELLGLELENMFDIDSIVSNVLQLVLLKEVPILQTKDEKTLFLNKLKGKFDVIFGFQHAIGTQAHRIFMEVAFAYQSRYKFALSTEHKVIRGLLHSEDVAESAVWLLRCTEVADKNNYCTEYRYWDNMDLMSLVKFIKFIDVPHVYDNAEIGNVNPFEELSVHLVYVFYDESTYNDAMTEASELDREFFGMIGILMINIVSSDATQYGYDYDRMKTPTLTFQYRGEDSFSILPRDLKPVIFVNNHLSRVAPSIEKKNRDGVPVSQLDEDSEPFIERDPELDEEMSPQELARFNEMEMIEKQDDHVAAVLWEMRNVKVDRTHIPALNDQTFYTEIQDKDLLVVLFYLKFESRGMAFLHHYSTASHQLAKDDLYPLAAIDCFDWTDVCGNSNITSYPTIKIYRKKQDAVLYSGMLSRQAIVSTVYLMLAGSPIQLHTMEDYNKFIEGKIPENISENSDVAVVGLFTNENSRELTVFEDVAKEFEGKLLFAYFTGEVASQISRSFKGVVASVVVHKRHDSIEADAVYTDQFTAHSLTTFIFSQALPVFPELTVTNLPAYMSKKKPFVILFISKNDTKYLQVFTDLIKSNQYLDYVFCWMNVTNHKSLAATILSQYSPVAVAPWVSFVNHEAGSVYNYNGAEITQEGITGWINTVATGKSRPSKMLEQKVWKPRHEGYDFLKMIEEEQRNKKNEVMNRQHIEHEEDDFDEGEMEEEDDDEHFREHLQQVPDDKSSRWRGNKQVKDVHSEL